MEFAIVGGAVALPGVDDLDRMRADLHAGTTHFESVTRAQSLAAGLGESEVEHDNYVPTASLLDEAELFDREFFRMTAAEAGWTDPQHRLLLTLTHDAMESAGAVPDADRIGVYTTIGSPSYLWGRVAAKDQPSPARVDYQSLLGNDRDFVSSRIAYKFGFTGPAMTIQSACSSSLVALHQACLALAYGDIDGAVVGAASLHFPQGHGYIHEPGGILSPTGQTRPFDASADGTLRGSGGGVVIVRRLDDAVANEDNILAVVAGSAVNNDGANRMGYSAPSVQGQFDVLTRALDRAEVDPDRIDYVEAHGTGTLIGDPIEFRALSRAYAGKGDRVRPCYLGSAKANYGHLDVAAGMVGLLKAALVLDSGTIFPQPGYTEPNPAVALDSSPFDIATSPRSSTDMAYASVSSFGMGGTNAHVVLRKAPRRPDSAAGERVSVTLSARSDETLSSHRLRLAEYLRARPDLDVRDVASTLDGRTRHDHVWTSSAASVIELADQLARDHADAAPAATATGRRIWLPPVPLLRVRHVLPLLVGEREPIASPKASGADVRSAFLCFVSEELGTKVDAETDFFAAGGESMTLVTLVGKLTDQLGFRADFDELDGFTEIGDMITVLEKQARAQHRGRSGHSSLIVYGAHEPEIYLYPPAGGTNFCYAALHRMAPEHTLGAFRAVQHGETVEEIAARCVDVMRSRGAIHENVVLGGYSFGGNVAFEMARLLEREESVSPRHIVMIDSFAPGSFRGTTDRSGQLVSEVEGLLQGAARDLADYDPTSDTDTGGGQVLDGFRTVWTANNRALARYRPEDGIRSPITLLRARTRLSSARAAALDIDVDRTSRWSEWTTSSATILDVPGDHYSLFTDPADRAVTAEQFTRVLRAVQTGSSTAE